MDRAASPQHPSDATDLMWWVLLGGEVFMEDPYEHLEDAAAALEARIADGIGSDNRMDWSVKRLSRAWGYRNLTGT